MNHSPNSGAQESLAHHEWSLHVGHLCCVDLLFSIDTPTLLVGSSSRLSTTSSMSSEDVALTGGQSGYVAVDILFPH